MARKCDTAKYRKRMAKERQNRKAGNEKLRMREEMWANKRKLRESQEAMERDRHLHDPRTIIGQRLVNVLSYKLRSNPLWRLREIGRMLGIPDLIISTHYEPLVDGCLEEGKT
jgi:hypothetical protein